MRNTILLLLLFFATQACSHQVDNIPQPRDAALARDTLITSPAYDLQFLSTQLSNIQLASLVSSIGERYQNITQFLGTKPKEKVLIKVFPSTEEKGLATRNTRPATLYFKEKQIHIVSNKYFPGEHQITFNQWFIRKALQVPATKPLEIGLAGVFAPNFIPMNYKTIAQSLAKSTNLPPLQEVLDDELFEKESPILMQICAAALVDFLLHKWGKTTFLERYRKWKPTANELSDLNKEWRQFIIANYPDTNAKTAQLPDKLHGFNFAHEGYRIYNGYGSKLAKQSLDTLMKLGINAIAIVPYTFMRDRFKPSFFPLVNRAGSETDESVILTHLQAKEKSLITLLKPQIWVHGSWPGAIEMKSKQDWNLFFEYYYRWMRHYALIAEIYHIDILCLGVELSIATTSHPEQWKTLIQKTRGIYHGKITYAANWGAEFEDFDFGHQLDYIAINCYYPISQKKRADEEELRKGFQKIIKKIEQKSIRTERPVLITEIGFRSIQAPWIHPHEDYLGQPQTEKDQALCYQIVLEELEQYDWCKGIFWWKWPSYLDYMSDNRTGFSPNRKLAEKVFRQFHE